jgi:hypothetical protein
MQLLLLEPLRVMMCNFVLEVIMSDASSQPPRIPSKRRFLNWKIAVIAAIAAIVVGGIVVVFAIYPQQAAREAIGNPVNREEQNFKGPQLSVENQTQTSQVGK